MGLLGLPRISTTMGACSRIHLLELPSLSIYGVDSGKVGREGRAEDKLHQTGAEI